MSIKPKVLLMADWFEPGYKAGGPIRSCVNFCEHLKNDLDIHVLTTDRDLGEERPYEGIRRDQWIDFNEQVRIFYASPEKLSYRSISKIIGDIQPDVVYLNSMYSKYFSLYPLLMKRRKTFDARVVLAPRGMLKASAIQFKKRKKKIFLLVAKLMGLQKDVFFHCTDEQEIQDVKKYFGQVNTTLLPNLPGYQMPLQKIRKNAGDLKLLFVGRIHPIKSLDFLLRLMKDVKARVALTIIGNIEDATYYTECKKLAEELPPHISVEFKRELPHREIEKMLVANHVFILPTKGENFGHAIFEALAVGRPAIISDQTPWRNLEKVKAGFDISLNDPGGFRAEIDRFASMEQDEFDQYCEGAWQLARTRIENQQLKQGYLKLFTA